VNIGYPRPKEAYLYQINAKVPQQLLEKNIHPSMTEEKVKPWNISTNIKRERGW
jgi:hypothetical protein